VRRATGNNQTASECGKLPAAADWKLIPTIWITASAACRTPSQICFRQRCSPAAATLPNVWQSINYTLFQQEQPRATKGSCLAVPNHQKWLPNQLGPAQRLNQTSKGQIRPHAVSLLRHRTAQQCQLFITQATHKH